MDVTYDLIVLGTGLKETVLSGLFAAEEKKILNIDTNKYYGSETASLNITQLFDHFGRKDEDPQSIYGHNRGWNVDLVPKFIMADGQLVKTLVKTKVESYMDFQVIKGSFVTKQGRVQKVPSSSKEVWDSKLMKLLEKNRFRKFLIFVDKYETETKYDLMMMTARELFRKFKLSEYTSTFVGHAMALYRSEEYLDKEAGSLELVQRVSLYINSISKHGYTPYVYPMYGLGDLPQAFSRLSAIYGGVYMLDRPVEDVFYDEDGRVAGIVSQGEKAYANTIIAAPEYFPDKVKEVSRVVRCVCIMDHPIPNTKDYDSAQIIIPQSEVGRNSDIYVCGIGNECVCPKGYFLGFVSTGVETDNPAEELEPGLRLLGPVLEQFVTVSPVYEPINDAQKEGIFITGSYDETTHFETTMLDVFANYEQISGRPVDLDAIRQGRGD